jgi:hypothetical protein
MLKDVVLQKKSCPATEVDPGSSRLAVYFLLPGADVSVCF